MNPSFRVAVLSMVFSLAVIAQETTQEVSRTLPVRLNPADVIAPPPPVPSGIGAASKTIPAAPKPVLPAPAPNPPLPNTVLAWDSELKEYNAKFGEAEAHFTFSFTNISSTNVLITSATASCGCTVPKLPSVPWTNAPGAFGQIPVTMNLAGKSGVVFKTITVNTDLGSKILTVKVNIAAPPVIPPPPMDRNKNQATALADRQAVFRGDCARCHVVPTYGKKGAELYKPACGICHEAEHRATMVPDLHALNHDTNPDFWKTWIAHGKPGSLMPAFTVTEGGPLNDPQINSLVDYLSATIPAQAVKSGTVK